MNHTIKDSFMNPSRFGYANIPFKVNGEHGARDDIPQWRIARSNSRSIGKPTYLHTKPCKCVSVVRRVYNNECFDCFKGKKK